MLVSFIYFNLIWIVISLFNVDVLDYYIPKTAPYPRLKFNQFKKFYINDSVIYHIANSFATEYSNRLHNDMVRTGFLLYGYGNNTLGNKPVMNIYSKIINVLSVRKGASVGYDRTFIADRNMKVAVVPIGYADGFGRRLSNNFYLLVRDENDYKTLDVIKDVLTKIVNHKGEIFGNTREECGNYREHDLKGAKE